jgi:hypothetical protein
MAALDELADDAAPLRAALGELEGLADQFGRAMTTAFRQSVVDGKRLEDVLRSLALSLSGRALNAALAPIGRGIGAILGGAAKGFSRSGDAGLGMGDWRQRTSASPIPNPQSLGGRGGGAGQVNVTFNVTTPDAGSFRRAEAEITAMLARAVARGQRGL